MSPLVSLSLHLDNTLSFHHYPPVLHPSAIPYLPPFFFFLSLPTSNCAKVVVHAQHTLSTHPNNPDPATQRSTDNPSPSFGAIYTILLCTHTERHRASTPTHTHTHITTSFCKRRSQHSKPRIYISATVDLAPSLAFLATRNIPQSQSFVPSPLHTSFPTPPPPQPINTPPRQSRAHGPFVYLAIENASFTPHPCPHIGVSPTQPYPTFGAHTTSHNAQVKQLPTSKQAATRTHPTSPLFPAWRGTTSTTTSRPQYAT